MFKLLLSMIMAVSGHLTGISSCTDPAEPGNITFFLATYHSYTGAVAPGTVHIRSPAGIESTFSLDKSRQANPIWNGPLIMTGSEWDSNIKSTYNYNNDVSCSHYGDKPDGELTYPALNENERQSCGFNSVYTYYTATLSNAVSGTYTLWLTGTDAILAYQAVSNAITPCEDSELVVDLIISDGLLGCDNLPSSVLNANSPPSYCSNVISGYRCPTTCLSGYYATGYTQCTNGTWTGNFQCFETLPCLSSDINSVLNDIDLTKVIGILGSGCDFTILNGTQCSLSCVNGYYGTGNIECFNGTFVSNNANCSVIVPTPSPTPNPTPSPTPLQTPSPTPNPTPSPTPNPTPIQQSRKSSNDIGDFFSDNLRNIIIFLVFICILVCCFSSCLILICLYRRNLDDIHKNKEKIKKLELQVRSHSSFEQGDKI